MEKIVKYWDNEPAFVVSGDILKKMQDDTIVMCENFGTNDVSAIQNELDDFFKDNLKCGVTKVTEVNNCIYLVETDAMPDPAARMNMRNSGINIYWGNDFLDNYAQKSIHTDREYEENDGNTR